MNDIFEGLESVIGGDNIRALKTPCYVIDEKKLIKNAEVLASVMSRTGCKILLAQKAFSNYDFYPLISGYLSGTEASGLFEARLGKEEMPDGEVHVFCAAYRDDEFDELLNYADHIVFNTVTQLKKFGKKGILPSYVKWRIMYHSNHLIADFTYFFNAFKTKFKSFVLSFIEFFISIVIIGRTRHAPAP